MKKIICFLSFLLLISPFAKSKTLEQELNVEIGIFDAAKVVMSYSLDDRLYNFSSKVETSGLFAKLYYFSALYSSNGSVKNDSFIAKDYNYISKSKSHTRTKKLVFDEQGNLIERISSKDKKEKKVDINLGDKHFDFHDLQSVFAYLTKQLKESKFCDMQKEVFDGKKTYKVTIKDEGNVIINDEDVNYKGDAKKCSLFIKRVDFEEDDLLFNTTAERPIYFWVVQDQKTLMPYVAKIEIDSTPLGKLKAYTTNVNIKD